MKDRIQKFITKEGISPAHFADEIGVQRSSVSHILSGRNNPSFDFIQKILDRYKNLNAEWLIMGLGEMYKKVEKNISFFSDPVRKEVSSLQKDLFTENNAVKSEAPPVYASPKEKEMVVEASGNKLVEKIIVFYSDKTFVEFRPSS
jgi:transcriptional regulator with XRE-family HTH domain